MPDPMARGAHKTASVVLKRARKNLIAPAEWLGSYIPTMLKRLIIFLCFIGMIAALFQPYVGSITGYDFLFTDAGSILNVEAKLILALSPLLGLLGLFVFFKKWHSAVYIFLALVVLGVYGYYGYGIYSHLKFATALFPVKISQLNMTEFFKLLGLGAYLQLAALVLVIVFGIKDPINKMRAKPAVKPARPAGP